MHLPHRRGLTACVLGLALLWPFAGRADEESKEVCASAFADAQRLIRAERLLEAKEKLVLCGGPRCPLVMHSECQQLLSSLEASIPTIVFQVVAQAPSSSGAASPDDVRVSIDGGESVSLSSRAISLDPGPHNVTFTAKGFRTIIRPIVLIEGEKLRRESVTLTPSLAALPANRPAASPLTSPECVRAAAPRSKRLAVPFIVATAAAAFASVSAVSLGIEARNDDRQLDFCAPTASCSRSAVDHVRSEYLWTNISIGAAAAAVMTAAVLFFLDHRAAEKTDKSALAVGAAHRDLHPTPAGAL